MKKCKIKAPKYAFGAKEIGNMLLAGGNLAQGINGGNQTAQAVFNGIDSTLGNIPVIGKFAKIASGLGKIGTAIVGTKGSVDEVTGDITEGSGILGRRNRGRLRQQSGIVKNNIAAALNSARVAADWYSENGYNGLSYVANGGIIPNTLAYLDDGEEGRTPDGLIFEVPELGKPTDSNLVNVPVGTLILSDKIKPKGSKDTYAKMYEKNKAKTNMKGKDIYALNSKMLNDRYNQSLYDLYLAMLESNKKSKSTKLKFGKYDTGTPYVSAGGRKKVPIQYEYDQALAKFGYTDPNTGGFIDMDDVPNHLLPDSTYTNRPFHYNKKGKLIIDLEPYTGNDIYVKPTKYETKQPLDGKTNDTNKNAEQQENIKDINKGDTKKDIKKVETPETATGDGKSFNYADIPTVPNVSAIMYDFWKDLFHGKEKPVGNWKQEYQAPWQGGKPAETPKFEFVGIPKVGQTPLQLPVTKADAKKVGKNNSVQPSLTTKQNIGEPRNSFKKFGGLDENKMIIPNGINSPIKNRPYGNIGSKGLESVIFPSSIHDKPNGGKWDWLGDVAGATAGLIGPLMNITAKRGEPNVPYTYTPKYGPTDYNINPLLRSIDDTYSMANYNMANLNPNTGANMAFGLQAAINRDKQMTNAYATKNNQENNMAMQNAGIYNNWGLFNANAQHTAAVENAQDLAAVNLARRQGWSDFSTALQTMNKDRRLMQRDALVANAFAPFFDYSMSPEFMSEFNKLRKRRNYVG